MSVQICVECKRSERFESEAEFQAKPVAGSLVQVCKGCFLVSELSQFLAGLESAEIRLTVVSGLEALYVLAKTQAETELEGHGAEGDSEKGGRKRRRTGSRRRSRSRSRGSGGGEASRSRQGRCQGQG